MQTAADLQAQSFLVPLILAALIYAFLTFLVLPLYRRHRQRYAQYLPLSTPSLGNLSSSTYSIRQRASDALLAFLLPSRFAGWRSRRSRVVDASDGERMRDEELGDLTDDSETDEMGMPRDSVTDRRRDAYERTSSRESVSDRRLSRELEEGFRDSSDDEDHAPPR